VSSNWIADHLPVPASVIAASFRITDVPVVSGPVIGGIAFLEGILMLKHLVTSGPAPRRRPRPVCLEVLGNRLCLSPRGERVTKRHLLIAALVAIVMTAFSVCAYADLLVSSRDSNSILRYNEATGAFIDEFVSSGSGGLNSPRSLLLGPDGNLYVSSGGTDSVMRYDGTTGAPLPAPGQMGAVFASGGGLRGPAGLILGRDGNLYVDSQNTNSVLRYSGTTGGLPRRLCSRRQRRAGYPNGPCVRP
jgi:hypothetical protein